MLPPSIWRSSPAQNPAPAQFGKYFLRHPFGGPSDRLDPQLGVLGRLARRIDAAEVLHQVVARLGVETLGIALDANVDRREPGRVHELLALDKPAPHPAPGPAAP